MKDIIEKIINFDPARLADLPNEDMAEFCKAASEVEGVIARIRKEAGQVLLTRFEGDGAVFGKWAVTRSSMPNYSKVDMEMAENLGAMKKVLDTTKLGFLIKKGLKVEGITYTYYPRITNFEKSEAEENV